MDNVILFSLTIIWFFIGYYTKLYLFNKKKIYKRVQISVGTYDNSWEKYTFYADGNVLDETEDYYKVSVKFKDIKHVGTVVQYPTRYNEARNKAFELINNNWVKKNNCSLIKEKEE